MSLRFCFQNWMKRVCTPRTNPDKSTWLNTAIRSEQIKEWAETEETLLDSVITALSAVHNGCDKSHAVLIAATVDGICICLVLICVAVEYFPPYDFPYKLVAKMTNYSFFQYHFSLFCQPRNIFITRR